MKQQTTQLFESENGKAKIYVDHDMAIGEFHDFLTKVKGMMVDRMVEAQKAQEKQPSEE